jgi:hypothetical protein
MENTTKNMKQVGGASGNGFDVNGQPSSEAKKRGWERRREAQEIMDMIMGLKNLSWYELEGLRRDIELHPDKHTVLEVKMVQYLTSSKFTIDFLDRHISKAPANVDLTTNGKDLNTLSVEQLKNALGEVIKDGNITETK